MFGRKRARNAAALRAWAGEHGMSYLAGDKALAKAPWLAPLGSGSGRATSHVLRGTYRGHQVLLLTLSSKRSTPGPEGTTQVDKREQGIYTIQLPGILPRIEVRPRYSVGDLARAVRDRDEAVGRGDFEGAYELQTEDAQLAAPIMHPPLRAWLLERTRPASSSSGTGYSTPAPEWTLAGSSTGSTISARCSSGSRRACGASLAPDRPSGCRGCRSNLPQRGLGSWLDMSREGLPRRSGEVRPVAG